MDMPSSCFKCPVGKNESIPLETAIVCMAKNKWVTDKQCESKPDWCPLCEVPKKIGIDEAVKMKRFGCIADIINSYNACIDEIMKGSKENG